MEALQERREMSAWGASGGDGGIDDPRRFVIGASEEAQISTLCQIAKHNGSVLNLSELIDATSMPTNEEELQVAWGTNPTLSSRYSLEAGWIVEKDWGSSGVEGAVERANWSRARSAWNIAQAVDFARLCVHGEVRLLAVSGGNSYDRAGPADDVDLFCVTNKDSMWLFMLRSLLLARAFRLLRRRTAPFCFSYVVEEERVRDDFARKEGGLFARDALMARVVHGQGFYGRLLRESPWMGAYFPTLYSKRAGEAVATEPQGAGPRRRGGLRAAANSFLFYTVGSYIKLKAYFLNGKYRRVGNISAVFRADIGKDRCVYESNRYRRLRRMYDGPLPARSGERA
ncbi:MAG: hypothetical protein OK456_00545 [Thaumarchaeota archaeon]|nr:hypothetical protein [Nitrososphaerota archaeon]